jgi:DNA helicase HerA-like ATPase
MRQVWYQLDRLNRLTLKDKTAGIEALISEGKPEKLEPAKFEPATTTNTAPWQGPFYGKLSPVPERLRIALEDRRLHFFVDPEISTAVDPLPEMLKEWLGNGKPVSILDFSGVPSQVTDLAVGALLNLVFDVAVACDDKGIGFPYPVLFILEEAHRYLGASDSVRMAREAANRIAREGRKYGVGLMLVSQRPSELPETALSQVGTLVALRLTNSVDQGRVRSALPDAVAGLADALPSLRNGEAIISGEATRLPTRVRVDLPSPEPDAKDPSLDRWRVIPKDVDIAAAVAAFRMKG